MTTYVTPEDVVALVENTDLVQLTNLTRTYADFVESVRLKAACDAANGELRGYLALVDLDTITDDIRSAAKSYGIGIALYYLDPIQEAFIKMRESAIAWLEALISAAKSSGDSGGGISGDLYSGIVLYEGGRDVWNDRTLEGLF